MKKIIIEIAIQLLVIGCGAAYGYLTKQKLVSEEYEWVWLVGFMMIIRMTSRLEAKYNP